MAAFAALVLAVAVTPQAPRVTATALAQVEILRAERVTEKAGPLDLRRTVRREAAMVFIDFD